MFLMLHVNFIVYYNHYKIIYNDIEGCTNGTKICRMGNLLSWTPGEVPAFLAEYDHFMMTLDPYSDQFFSWRFKISQPTKEKVVAVLFD